MVIGYKGRWKYKQYNASKPSKYQSETGYVFNLFTYYGSETCYHPDSDPDGSMAEKVFQTLIDPLSKGHHIYADRFYTSFPLLQFLSSKSHHYTGTVDIHRKNFPLPLKTLKLEKKWNEVVH